MLACKLWLKPPPPRVRLPCCELAPGLLPPRWQACIAFSPAQHHKATVSTGKFIGNRSWAYKHLCNPAHILVEQGAEYSWYESGYHEVIDQTLTPQWSNRGQGVYNPRVQLHRAVVSARLAAKQCHIGIDSHSNADTAAASSRLNH